MFSLFKAFVIGILSLTDSLNNTEFINYHNSKNLSYQVGENQFSERKYMNEFYPSENHFIVINSTNKVLDDKFPPFHQSIDWRENNKVSSVKDQEKCGGCWAFSSSEAVESAWAIQNNVLYNFFDFRNAIS